MASDIGWTDDDLFGAGDADGQNAGEIGPPPWVSPATLDFRIGRDDPEICRLLPFARSQSSQALRLMLQPALADALAAPPGTLSRDDLVGRTADVLHQALGHPDVAPEHFADLVGRSVDFLNGLPDDEAGIRQALGRLARDRTDLPAR